MITHLFLIVEIQSTSIDENSGAGQVIYTANATDADNLNPIIYTLQPSGDASSFSIDRKSEKVTLIGDPDYETKSEYTFTVIASDDKTPLNKL